MFLFKRKNSTKANSGSNGSANNSSSSEQKQQFTFAIQIESIDNIPLYFQVPLGVELHKLNLTTVPSQAILTLKGKLFRKRKLIGNTPFKLADSATKQSNFSSTLEFLVNIPVDKEKKYILKGPVTSSTVFEPTCNDSQQPEKYDENNESDDESATMCNNSMGKFLHIVVAKKITSASKSVFVNDCLLDLTHYCSLQHEWQGRVSVPFEISKDVTANINLQIFSVLGNQLSSNGRRSGSLDVQRGRTNSLSTTPPQKRIDTPVNDTTDTSPQQQLPKTSSNSTSSTPVSTSTSTLTSATPTASPPQIPISQLSIKEVDILQFESNTISPTTNSDVNDNGRAILNTNTNNVGNFNNNSNGLSNQGSMSDFFKRRAEVNSGRSRSDSSPGGLQLTNTITTSNKSSMPLTPTFDNNLSHSPTGAYQTTNSSSESPSLESIKQENAHLRSVLQRAKTRFQEVVTENTQLKERIQQLEAQVLSLQLAQSSGNQTQPKTMQDFFDPFQ
ncbi:hypothetical protein C9374_002843 [Naegleria lovaniensis]|uniref:C2 NT-type domain-containing protein n=1 Tax=Naegleria lovaniensis TaxID=51637 RepID=A0AA88KQF7_NAELO|nr:uncharacterized protein C9374_002843 [Naegleria lovaniensis]KAG2386397.1 hypothetical protein C9374_002843 [Naegleria lovaniensis]